MKEPHANLARGFSFSISEKIFQMNFKYKTFKNFLHIFSLSKQILL